MLTARHGLLRLRLLGVAVFLRVDPPASLSGRGIVRIHRRRR